MNDDLPLYPDEKQLAKIILGPARASAWPGLATVLERHGLPMIDPMFGGRYLPAVRAFLDRRNGLEKRTIPAKPGGGENWDAQNRNVPRSQAHAPKDRTR